MKMKLVYIVKVSEPLAGLSGTKWTRRLPLGNLEVQLPLCTGKAPGQTPAVSVDEPWDQLTAGWAFLTHPALEKAPVLAIETASLRQKLSPFLLSFLVLVLNSYSKPQHLCCRMVERIYGLWSRWD